MTTFSETLGEQLKIEGMELATIPRKEQLEIARTVAAEIATRRITRCVTADDVGRVLQDRYGIESLGPAAGSIFKTSDWAWTGQYLKSKRVSNHSRMLREWKYIGGMAL